MEVFYSSHLDYNICMVFKQLSKKTALDFRLRYKAVQRDNWDEYGYAFENRFLITKNIFLYHEWKQDYQFNSQGFAVRNYTHELEQLMAFYLEIETELIL